MVMSWIWTGFLAISLICAILTGRGANLSAAVAEGAQAGVTLGISIAGSVCLWSGVGKLMSLAGITGKIGHMLSPVLHRLFPSTKSDTLLADHLSVNISANLLGLGNAATPAGILAAKRMNRDGSATDELCRLIVLNTASIQLIPANVAAVRTFLGCKTPYDILPAVWLTSISSAGLGLCCAALLGGLQKK